MNPSSSTVASAGAHRVSNAPESLEEIMAYPDHSPGNSEQWSNDPEVTHLGDANEAWESAIAAPPSGYGTGMPTPRAHEDQSGDASPDATEQAKQTASRAGDRAKDVAGRAQEEAGAVKDTAVAAGADVADSVAEQAGNVAEEVGQQSRRLLDEGKSELQTQASAGQQRLAELSRSFGSELQSMTRNSDQSGPITDLASNAQHVFDDAANWLERNEPGDVLESVRRYASHNPWKFLAISAGVGFVGARIVRGLQKPDDATAQPALDVPAGYHGNATASLSPMEDPTYAGGPRYGGQGRVQPSATPATSLPPLSDPVLGTGPGGAPLPDPSGGPRGLR